jgi:hypothetical protein
VRFPERPFESRHYDAFRGQLKRIMRRHFPAQMAVRMLLKPVRLPAPVQRLLVPALTRISTLAFV